MNPEEEWETWREWLGREPRGRSIYAEMVELQVFRKIWRGFVVIQNRAPEQARKDATFLWWVNWNYARGMGSAIRRQVDTGRDIVSLGRLIDRVWRYPTVLTRERYRALQGDDNEMADQWFEEMAGPGEFINPEIPAGDMERLRSETLQVRQWVNKAVAHLDQRERKPPNYQEIHRCVDVVYELFQKYANLIQGVHVGSDVVMTAWPTIFRTAWIPEEDWAETLTEVERAGREGI